METLEFEVLNYKDRMIPSLLDRPNHGALDDSLVTLNTILGSMGLKDSMAACPSIRYEWLHANANGCI